MVEVLVTVFNKYYGSNKNGNPKVAVFISLDESQLMAENYALYCYQP